MKKINARRRRLLYQTSIFVATAALIVFFMPRDGKFNYQFSLNSPWKYSQLMAPFDFPIAKSEERLQQEREQLLSGFVPYYQHHRATGRAKADSLATLAGSDAPDELLRTLSRRLQKIYDRGILPAEEEKRLTAEGVQQIMVIEENSSSPVPIGDLYTEKSAYRALTQGDTAAATRRFLQRHNLSGFIEPDIVYSRERSELVKKELLANLATNEGFVMSGQKIVDRGELVDEQIYRILESMRDEWNERVAQNNQTGLILIGQILFVSLILLILFVYINLFRADFLLHRRKLLLLFATVVLFSIVIGLMMRFHVGNVFMVPLAMAPIILRVFMDSRTAFVGSMLMILICSIVLNYSYEFVLLETVATLTAIYSLRELSQRSQLFRSALLIFVAYAVTFFAYELVQENDLGKINLAMYLYFGINGLLLLFTYPLMYVIEKAFGFTSNVTLVELSNINHPLLRELSQNTPGTFQHSLQVSNLAAEAAHRIGADSQLVRTAALYHDIGKMNHPIYFTENQQGVNPHSRLSYTESARLIINHVTEGVKLADKHHLPAIIKEFILTHHGQGQAKYFYISYKNEHPDEEVDPAPFTYPGPNPYTQEMAILMMADAVEAASKSLKEYTEENISNMIERIIDGQLRDGFFTECPITFKQIATIKTVFKERLKSIYHTRINYPEEKRREEKKEA